MPLLDLPAGLDRERRVRAHREWVRAALADADGDALLLAELRRLFGGVKPAVVGKEWKNLLLALVAARPRRGPSRTPRQLADLLRPAFVELASALRDGGWVVSAVVMADPGEVTMLGSAWLLDVDAFHAECAGGALDRERAPGLDGAAPHLRRCAGEGRLLRGDPA